MATITTDTFLDDGTARTAGEAWTINGATLTIRTDTRWHAGSPASMTGSLALITSTNGNGGFIVDGRDVRWMAFDTGSGTVPAIGTTITQGGVSGYLLGVWADYTSAPTAVGASMPASGYIKFREVTGGPFSVGALTGISANATSPDVTGWIEVVRDQSASFGAWSLGDGVKFYGQWFDLGTTSGSAGQIIQVPTNGGGSGTLVLGVQIETGVGTGVYEWWPAVPTAQWTSTSIATDARAKAVQQLAGGQVRIGSNGTTNLGYTPVSGCKIRMPNIFLRQCTTAARASNAQAAGIGSWPQMNNSNNFYIDRVECQWDFRLASWYSCTASSSSFGPIAGISNSFASASFTDCAITNPFAITACAITGNISHPVTFTNCTITTAAPTTAAIFDFGGITGLTLDSCKIMFIRSSKTSAPFGIRSGSTTSAFSSNITITNLKLHGCNLTFANTANATVTNTDFIERMEGATTTTSIMNWIFTAAAGCRDIVFDGLTFGLGGTLANCHPYGSLINFVNVAGNVKARNFGTYASPLPAGASPTLYPQRIANMSATRGTPQYLQRIYLENCRDPSAMSWAGDRSVVEHVGTPNVTKVWSMPSAVDSFARALVGANWGATSAARGLIWYDQWPTSTTGMVVFLGTAPESFMQPYTSYSFSALGGFTSGGVVLTSTSDYFISETPYFIKGHSGFQNVTPGIAGTNITTSTDLTYQIDIGSGWNGTWKVVSGANLSAETIDGNVGFKLKIKLQFPSGSTRTLQALRLATNSNATLQGTNFYPLDANTLTFTGLIPGSEVRCYTGSDPATATEIGGTESTGTTYSFTHSSGGTAGVIVIFAMGYQPFYLPYTFKSVDDSILVQQVIDRNYVNPA